MLIETMVHLMDGEFTEAKQKLMSSGDSPLALIAQAMIDFNEYRVLEALQGFKKIVNLNPNCPMDIWLAIGICYFKLKNLPKAKFALEHVIHNDPCNSMALTSLGIVELLLNST